tara:strand:- start:4587 stop:5315 length:729 start_codon:yes stop_codon:yes gene_type:complete
VGSHAKDGGVNVTEAKTYLRLIVGDQSEGVWSDTEIQTVLERSNRRVWRLAATKRPQDFVIVHTQTYTKDANEINLAVNNSAGSAREIMSIEKAHYQETTSTDFAFIEIPMRSLSEVREGESTWFLEQEIMRRIRNHPYEMTFVRNGLEHNTEASVMIRPRPSQNLSLRLYVVPAEPYTTSLSSGGTNLLDGKHEATHEAVIFDAAYLLSFKDKSLRQEFAMERERILMAILDEPLSYQQVD